MLLEKVVLVRFWSKVCLKQFGCWEWVGYVDGKGYGEVKISGRKFRAHRVAYQDVHGEIPTGLDIDHLCRNKRCVNPDHLEAVSHKINVLRGTAPSAKHAVKTHCHRGHPFTPENTYINDKTGARQCKTCRAAYCSERYRTHKQADLERQRIYRNNNRDLVNERQRKRYHNHRR